MIRTLLCSALLLAGTGVAADASAAVFDVTATVVTACLIDAGNTLAFGNYDPTIDTAKTGTTTIRARCTNGTIAQIALNQGGNVATGSTCTVPLRQMASGTERLSYHLNQTGTGTPWGCTVGTNTRTHTAPNASWNTLTVFGVIPAGQNALIGAYTDTVTASITF